MPLYDFECPECLRSAELLLTISDRNKPVQCTCGALMKRIMVNKVAVVGSRDGFGIGKEFRDPKSGKVIDNWKSWEKAGYKDARDLKLPSGIKNQIKDKAARTKFNNSPRFNKLLGGM